MKIPVNLMIKALQQVGDQIIHPDQTTIAIPFMYMDEDRMIVWEFTFERGRFMNGF